MPKLTPLEGNRDNREWDCQRQIVRAREDLPEGLCIPYGGVYRSRQEAINIEKTQ